MPANECIPYRRPGEDFTFKATAAVTGKRFVKISGNRTGGPGLSTDLANVYQCAHAGAGEGAVGVAGYDVASGALGPAKAGGIVPVTAGAAITAGDPVKSDAAGKAIPQGGTGVILGTAMTGAADGADAEIKLSL